jgi:hypothetical protein
MKIIAIIVVEYQLQFVSSSDNVGSAYINQCAVLLSFTNLRFHTGQLATSALVLAHQCACLGIPYWLDILLSITAQCLYC